MRDAVECSLGDLPELLRDLPKWHGWPVPWFAAWREAGPSVEAGPDFKAGISDAKFLQAQARHVCMICGRRLRPNQTSFFGNIAGAVSRVSYWPPAHAACAEWTLEHCPYMRSTEPGKNAGVSMVWVTRYWRIVKAPAGGRPYYELGVPQAVSWFIHGRSATRDEVLRAQELERGPLMFEAVRRGKTLYNLRRHRVQLERWLPAK